jgi:hypothetical protein
MGPHDYLITTISIAKCIINTHTTGSMASQPLGDALILGAPDGVEGKAINLPSHEAINAFNEKIHRLAVNDGTDNKDMLEPEIKAALPLYEDAENDIAKDNEEHIIITGADAAAHLLSMRDDFESALTFRSILLASILAAFQAVMYQIYQVSLRIDLCVPVIAHTPVSSNLH